MKLNKKTVRLLLAVLLVALLFAARSGVLPFDLFPTGDAPAAQDETVGQAQQDTPAPEEPSAALDEDGVYTDRDELALYIHTFGRLPQNFVTKDEARAAGWEGGSLEAYCPGKCIGGDRFSNREGLLPEAPGRVWTECDVNTLGARSRGAERLVFSNDGLIYYTGDHYESFTQLY